MQSYRTAAIGKIGAIASVQVKLGGQSFSRQNIVSRRFDMGISRFAHLGDAVAIGQVPSRDQHLIDLDGMVG